MSELPTHNPMISEKKRQEIYELERKLKNDLEQAEDKEAKKTILQIYHHEVTEILDRGGKIKTKSKKKKRKSNKKNRKTNKKKRKSNKKKRKSRRN